MLYLLSATMLPLANVCKEIVSLQWMPQKYLRKNSSKLRLKAKQRISYEHTSTPAITALR
jgi:hypothetical protein